MPIEKLKLPKGRIVGGHPVKSEDKMNFQTKQPVLDQTGAKVQQWRVEYAIPKQEFLQHVWPQMQAEALAAYPNWQTIMDPQTGLPLERCDFSWKLVDGDSAACPKGSKTPYNTREGYPGHYVLTLKTEAFAPGCVVFSNGRYQEVQEHQVNTGDYIVANVDIKVHTNNDGGLYINPNGFELVQLGERISSGGGGNPDQLFGDASARTDGGFQGVLPQAGQVAPSPQPHTATPTAPVVAATPPQANPAPQMHQATAASLSNPPAPAHDLVQNATAAGNLPPAVPATQPLPSAPPTVAGTAAPATTLPSNPANLPPGLPQAR